MVVILSLLLSGNAYSSLNGQGKLKLSDNVLSALIHYLNPKAVHNKNAGHHQKGTPLFFAVSLSGTNQGYSYCPTGRTCRQEPARVKRYCEKGLEEKCYIFARGRKIVWNGINYRFKRNASAIEIKDKLKEWGFIGTASTAITPEITKKVKKSTNTDTDDIVSQIKGLKELLDAGAITQDEFDKAKKKLLN